MLTSDPADRSRKVTYCHCIVRRVDASPSGLYADDFLHHPVYHFFHAYSIISSTAVSRMTWKEPSVSRCAGDIFFSPPGKRHETTESPVTFCTFNVNERVSWSWIS